ncbi:hypothetical protein FN846DRAFT_525471 [Sphaerosporella brunnea]|uniref:Uncharacterized protein n=1 Tax=Sphaerosporella brunnea TaxID=1250544 RepID=A0A5J5F3J8_9PEZI|nr:hypothetical protein FN846DRAFT_525471 [Sphaerosporella brunnea]
MDIDTYVLPSSVFLAVATLLRSTSGGSSTRKHEQTAMFVGYFWHRTVQPRPQSINRPPAENMKRLRCHFPTVLHHHQPTACMHLSSQPASRCGFRHLQFRFLFSFSTPVLPE